MMAYIVSLLILAFCLYLVITPLLKPKQKANALDKPLEDHESISIENVYATLNELEMDYNMKKLSEDDYLKLKREYEKLAAEIIEKDKSKEQKSANTKDDLVKDIEAEIEEELANLRKERGEK